MTQRDYHVRPKGQAVFFYKGGVSIDAGERAVVEPPADVGGIRGKVSSWSKASRRRMRSFLLIHGPDHGWDSFGATFTIPGNRCSPSGELLPPPTPEESKNLWDHFCKHYIDRYGLGMVWRIELQKRGAAHWHCLIVSKGSPAGGITYDGVTSLAQFLLRDWWLKSLEILGKHCFLQKWGEAKKEMIALDCFHSQIMGADRCAVDIQTDDGRGAWLRYLQDHATKSKQEQVAGEGWGRHWGLIGRKRFSTMRAYDSINFESEAVFARFIRAYQRLCTPVMKHRHRREKFWKKFEGRPFDGRAVGWRIKRGSHGKSVWFSNPKTVLRLARWAEGKGGGIGGEVAPE